MAIKAAPRIIGIDGPPGCGKTTAATVFAAIPGVSVLPKFKTGLRDEDRGGIDGLPCSEFDFRRWSRRGDFYAYRFGGRGYGFFRADLDAALDVADLVVVAVRSSRITRRLEQDYERVVPVFLHADASLTRERVGDGPEAERRLVRAAEVWGDYDPFLYRYSIFSNGTPEEFAKNLHCLIDVVMERHHLPAA